MRQLEKTMPGAGGGCHCGRAKTSSFVCFLRMSMRAQRRPSRRALARFHNPMPRLPFQQPPPVLSTTWVEFAGLLPNFSPFPKRKCTPIMRVLLLPRGLNSFCIKSSSLSLISAATAFTIDAAKCSAYLKYIRMEIEETPLALPERF